MTLPHYIDVVFSLPLPPLTYTVDSSLSLPSLGSLIKAPLRNKSQFGIVTAIHSSPPSNKKIHYKSIESIEIDSLISPELFDLTLWISSYYGCSWGESIFSCISLSPLNRNSRLYQPFELTSQQHIIDQWLMKHQRSAKACLILKQLYDASIFYIPELVEHYGSYIRPYFKQWEEEKIILPYHYQNIQCPSIQLSQPQETVFQSISKQLNSFYVHLLHGVTGSGKTEVYCSLINCILKNRLSVLLMCPEISLAENMYQRLSVRYPHHTLLIHSQIETSRRSLYQQLISSYSPLLIIGSRLSVLSPLHNLGLIIVDEEHDSSYKQEENPRYHARDTAVMRAKMNNIPVILGSATPSIETFFNSRNKKYQYHSLSQRFGQAQLPKVLCIDMRFEKKIHFFLSVLLHQKIKSHLDRRHQIILFLNKKGSASMILCESCGQPEKCHFCDVTLTWYAKENSLKCHYCSRKIKKPPICRHCQSPQIKPVGVGTEWVYDAIQKSFPDARILQVDTDHIKKNDDFSQKIMNHDVDIIIGTQMIAKGWNFPSVKLVAVILAESNCLTADFRASEKAFQLICQVAGRSGRYGQQGEVIIQSYQPDTFYFKSAIQHDYISFYNEEIQLRKQYSYPPFLRIIQIIVRDASQKKGRLTVQKIFQDIRQKSYPKISFLGPSPMPVAYINSIYRYHLLIRMPKNFDFYPLLEDIKKCRLKYTSSILINTDPYSLF